MWFSRGLRLLNMFDILREKRKEDVKNLEISGAFLINLSKSFGCL